MKTFHKGGIHPHDNKISAGETIAALPLPQTVVVPLSQHIGAPAVAEVAKGDKVLAGQLIAKAGGFVSSPVHSPVSGEVVSVDLSPNGQGIKSLAITIRVEGDEWTKTIDRSDKLVRDCKLSAEEIVKKIGEAGIVGMGGATFPTQVKLTPPAGKSADTLIINGVECEPYLTSDHRVMLEKTAEVLIGTSLLARALGVKKSYIGIENNKPDAINALKNAAADFPEIEIVPLKVRYPQGGEKQLIAAVTGREVPSMGLPIDCGCVVQNVGTALAVYEAVQKNKPLIERVVTVTGKNIEKPSNFLARIGTPVSALIAAAGGIPENTGKIIGGGPMMGRAMSNVDAPVTKGTSGILVLDSKSALRHTETQCIKCGKCVSVCPIGLQPFLLTKLSQKQLWNELETNHAADCIECGCCTFSCPARLPLLDHIRLGKAETIKNLRAKGAC